MSIFEKAGPCIPWSGFFCFLALLPWPAIAQERSPSAIPIVVRGNTAASTNDILSLLAIAEGSSDSVSMEAGRGRILHYYHQRGFLFAEVRVSRPGNGFAVDVAITEGPRMVVGVISFLGNNTISERELISAMETGEGEPFDGIAVEADIRRMLALYERRGFPAARIAVESLIPEGDSISVTFRVNEGPTAAIDEFRLEGNKTTKDVVILREIDHVRGGVFTDETAASVRRALLRLGLFSSVSDPEYMFLSGGKGGLLVRVSEAPPNRFDGMVGYNPLPEGGGVVTGLIDVRFGNLFGTGRRLAVRWLRASAASQDISLQYGEPWVASLPMHLDLGLHLRRQDSTFTSTAYEARIRVPVSQELDGGITIEHRNTVPGERTSTPVLGSSWWNLGLTVRYDTRDHPHVPTSGLLYETGYEIGRKSAGGSVQETRRLSFGFETFAAVWQRQVVAFSIQGRDLSSPLLEQGDLFRLGGATSLRGYREQQFLGSRLVWSSVEYRLLSGGRSWFYGFVDAGYIARADRPSAGLAASEIVRGGYGVGARMETGLGLITVGLAFGDGDTFRTAKLHVRVENEF